MDFKKFKLPMKDVPFIGVLVLFAGFSLYGILSFNATFNEYADNMYASVVAIDVSTKEAATGDAIFSDVSTTDEGATEVAYFKQMGWISGYEDGSFKPANLVNRAEFLTILANVLDVDFTGGVYENCFDDVKNEWFSSFVCYAKVHGWVGGYGDGTFKPGQSINRIEAFKISISAFGLTVPSAVTVAPYPDVEIGAWYAPYAQLAKDGLIFGGDTFEAGKQMTRLMCVQMLYNILAFAGIL